MAARIAVQCGQIQMQMAGTIPIFVQRYKVAAPAISKFNLILGMTNIKPFDDTEWPPVELVLDRFESGLARADSHAFGTATAKPSPSELNAPPSASHDNAPPDVDPGPDPSFRLRIPVPEYVSRDRVRAFEQALQEQGGYRNRLAALDQAAYRVRATRAIAHREYRVY